MIKYPLFACIVLLISLYIYYKLSTRLVKIKTIDKDGWEIYFVKQYILDIFYYEVYFNGCKISIDMPYLKNKVDKFITAGGPVHSQDYFEKVVITVKDSLVTDSGYNDSKLKFFIVSCDKNKGAAPTLVFKEIEYMEKESIY